MRIDEQPGCIYSSQLCITSCFSSLHFLTVAPMSPPSVRLWHICSHAVANCSNRSCQSASSGLNALQALLWTRFERAQEQGLPCNRFTRPMTLLEHTCAESVLWTSLRQIQRLRRDISRRGLVVSFWSLLAWDLVFYGQSRSPSIRVNLV